jgi:hypothetical protein
MQKSVHSIPGSVEFTVPSKLAIAERSGFEIGSGEGDHKLLEIVVGTSGFEPLTSTVSR